MSLLYKPDFSKIPVKSITNKCIVLDLDSTLIHTYLPDKQNPVESIKFLSQLGIMRDPKLMDLRRRTYMISMDDVVDKKGTGIKTEMFGITRPHVTEFLIWCFSYFKIVAVWSAGRKKYVEAIVNFLFRDIRRPHIVYTYDDLDGIHTNSLTKPLQKMIDEIPGLEKYMSLANTVILDDNLSVFYSVNPDNGILIPAYKPPWNVRTLRTDDVALLKVMQWFKQEDVIRSKDVRTLDKTKIFQ